MAILATEKVRAKGSQVSVETESGIKIERYFYFVVYQMMNYYLQIKNCLFKN